MLCCVVLFIRNSHLQHKLHNKSVHQVLHMISMSRESAGVEEGGGSKGGVDERVCAIECVRVLVALSRAVTDQWIHVRRASTHLHTDNQAYQAVFVC